MRTCSGKGEGRNMSVKIPNNSSCSRWSPVAHIKSETNNSYVLHQHHNDCEDEKPLLCALHRFLFTKMLQGGDIHPFHWLKWSESCSVVSDSLWSYGQYSPWNSPGQNTGVGSLSFLQGIFPTQGLNPGLPHCRRILYQLGHKWSQIILEWVVYPFSRGSSQPRDWTGISCIAGRFFTNWAMREALHWLSVLQLFFVLLRFYFNS